MANELTEREKFLMREAMKAAHWYQDLDSWLSEVISDAGHIVEQHIVHDADRLHGEAAPQPDTVEPVHQFQPDGQEFWVDCSERDLRIYQTYGRWPTRTLYTHPPAKPAVAVDERAELERLRNLASKAIATSHAEEDAALVEILNGLRALLDKDPRHD